LNFYIKNITNSYIHTKAGTKDFLKVRKPGLFLKFLSISMLLDRIRIRVPNTDPDPGKPNQCKSMRIRIQDSQINADPDPQHSLSVVYIGEGCMMSAARWTMSRIPCSKTRTGRTTGAYSSPK
jgi:hypothetical protein